MATQNSKALVEAIKADLVARRQRWATNEDAFQITGRVAWELAGVGAQLIVKHPPQNAALLTRGPYFGQWVSHDAIAFPDGWVDCLVNAGPTKNENRPAWTWHPGPPPPAGSVLAPFDLDAGAGVIPPVVVPPTPPATVPLPDLSQLPARWSPSNFPPRSMEYYTEAAAGLEQVYRVVLGRTADFGGAGNWMYWIIERPEIATVAWVAARFMEGAEYLGRHPKE